MLKIFVINLTLMRIYVSSIDKITGLEELNGSCIIQSLYSLFQFLVQVYSKLIILITRVFIFLISGLQELKINLFNFGNVLCVCSN